MSTASKVGMSAHPLGSTWSKWDLHVHTPASMHQQYGGDTDEVWERFFQEIESLPPAFKVLGINDYLFVDGYRRVLKAKRGGRLQNIDLLLPVVELRLNKFGGSESTLRRVNYHVIFSNEVEPDVIEHSFVYALSNSLRLNPSYEQLATEWHSNLTRQSVEELGKLIYETTPESKRKGNFSFLHRGFSNLHFELGDIRQKLEFHYFKGKYLTAVGKAEWADVKWNYQITAEKKNVINGVDLVFSASKTPADWKKAKESLREAGVNHRLLDCSDAHFFSDSSDKDRLGNCYTWIKAAPTFDGLRNALQESENRIFVGEEPEKVKLVRENKTKYIRSLSISKIPGSQLEESWFDNQLDLNTDLVAIIGNKGSGKSALADVLGLLGDSRQQRAFSFLSKDKFRQPKANKAEHFEATLTWTSGKGVAKRLDRPVSEYAVETLKYIPQSFLEQVCNEVSSGEGQQFREELESVIFSHVEEPDRLGTSSLSELIRYRTQEIQDAVVALRDELRSINDDVVRLEEHSADEYREGLERLLAAKEEELSAHYGVRPSEVPEPESDPETRRRTAAVTDKLETSKLERDLWSALSDAAKRQQVELVRLASSVDKAVARAENIRNRFQTAEADLADGIGDLGIAATDIVKLTVDLSPLEAAQKLYSLLRQRTNEVLDLSDPDSYQFKLEAAEQEIAALQAQLDEPDKEYEAYLSALADWGARREKIVGSEDSVGSLRHLKKALNDINEVPARLRDARARRRKKAAEIHGEIKKLADVYRDLYSPVQDFIESHSLAKGKFELNFDVSIVEEGFDNRFFAYINRGRSGSFCGIAESSARLNDVLEQHDFDDEASTLDFLDLFVDLLHHDARAEPKKRVEVSEQLNKGYTAQSLYDFLFSLDYLKPNYTLRMGDKELHQLSPGERGTLLLIFYLLIDKDDVPLVIDQPEENLDNQTIFDLLVPCIREAKKRRQLFMVTHNPNLAVAGDAEQIVRASIDRRNGNRITYTSGPLEDFGIREMAMDILEGTRPAFDSRRSKYRAGPAQ